MRRDEIGRRGWWPRVVSRAGRGVERLYRWRLGWLFGHRLAVVIHVGRRSGRTYRTVLYVQRYDPKTREVTVVSVWGESDWLRNIRSAAATRVEIGRDSFTPAQRFLTANDIVDIERAFRRDHPLLTRGQVRLMHWPWPATDTQLAAISEPMRAVTFAPAGKLTVGPATRPDAAVTSATWTATGCHGVPEVSCNRARFH